MEVFFLMPKGIFFNNLCDFHCEFLSHKKININIQVGKISDGK